VNQIVAESFESKFRQKTAVTSRNGCFPLN